MIDLKSCTEATFKNKVENGFPIDDLNHEFKLLKGEIDELQDELQLFLENGDSKELSKEMADVAIFLINLAKMADVDLEQAILDKINYNKTRKYKKGTFRVK